MVNPNRGYCQCFGCGFWGDGLGFAAKALGLPLSETIRLVAADIGLSRETTPEQRSEALKITEGERRLRAQAATFEQVVGRAFRSAASLLRAAQAQTRNLKNEDDLDKPGLAEAFDAIVELEFLLDELDADDPARQYTALLWWERMINERKN